MSDIKAGDTVLCVGDLNGFRRPVKGMVYKVAKVEHEFGSDYIHPEGLSDGWQACHFQKVEVPKFYDGEMRVTKVDWEASYHTAKQAEKAAQTDLDAALQREKTLRKDLATAVQQGTELRETVYRVLEKERAAQAAIVAARTRSEMLQKELDALKRVLDEHKRMKRQLELAESYNFSRKGLTDSEVKRDLYNYVLAALGKKPLDSLGWTVMLLRGFFNDLDKQRSPWKTPVFTETFDSFKYGYGFRWRLDRPLSYIPIGYIPINFVVTDENPGATKSPCAEGCSHPDCKKDLK